MSRVGCLGAPGGSQAATRPFQRFGYADSAALRAKVWPLLDAGKVRPLIHATFPMAQAAQAHATMEADTHIGKLVLTVR